MERNLDTLLAIMFENIRMCHHRLFSSENADKEEAFHSLVEFVRENDEPQSEDILGIVRQVFPKQDQWADDTAVASLPISPVIIALTYGLRAHNARELQNTELAWSYMADCCYWSGVSVSGKGLSEVQKKERKEKASKAAQAKNKKYEEPRSHAYKIVRDRRPPDKGWPSMRNAAEKIEADLNIFISESKNKIPPVTRQTIEEWLSKMPDASELFQSAKGFAKT